MVSLWPWKASEDAASFERTLNTLTSKIHKAAATNEKQRQRSRRARVMWTLYAGFAYILATLLLTLVTGWRRWGIIEGTVVAGGPVLIYGVRYALTSYFDYRISKTEGYLQKLNKERDATIERLKEATKYNSTQQLLEKYGASPKQKEQASPSGKKAEGARKAEQPEGPRTGIAPPPTANIQRAPGQVHLPSTPQRQTANVSTPQGSLPRQQLPPPDTPSAEFAPNAFGPSDSTRQFAAGPTATFTQTHWYDRILDALLGEDETQPKNRIALICTECRLVNGQAPPGVRAVEDVGRWRCGGCHAWNGTEKRQEATASVSKRSEAGGNTSERDFDDVPNGSIDDAHVDTEDDGRGTAGADESSGVEVEADEEDTPPPSRNTRSKSKGKKK